MNTEEPKKEPSPFSFGSKNKPVILPDERTVYFRLFEPNASAVSVVGSFNSWVSGINRLDPEYLGMWQGCIRLKPGIYEYRFLVNNKWVDDPNAKKTVANAFGSRNAVLEVK